ncbi:MAG TPA: sugar phosphate nucleotidyltransferase [Chloroflexia bacterium]|nr:sugar phosphate nucleotidyltransferase [Chloroflexia bacterium]
MKVIIPAAGYGTRMRPHTHTRPKPLVPVAGRPSLDFVLDALEPLPIEELIFIVGRMGEQMEEYVKKNYSQYESRFIEQKVMRGQADAIALAEEYVQGDLLTLFVDTLFETDFSVLTNLKDDGAMFVAEVPDPSRFGIAVEGPDGFVTKLVEKPQDPESNLAVVGLYYFKDSQWLFRAIHKLIASGHSLKGEYYLTDAVQVMLDEGAKFRTYPVHVWEDTGTPDAVLHSNRYLLRGMDKAKEPYIRGTSLIIPPSFVAEDATLEGSVIGPYAAISEGVTVRDSIIKNSIVSKNATITSASLFGSIIGERAKVTGAYQTLNIGDDSNTGAVSASEARVDETFK